MRYSEMMSLRVASSKLPEVMPGSGSRGVRVRVTPEAARFAAQQAAVSAPGARGAKRTVERLVHGPLSALVLTGKLTRHTSWAAVYDEGGIYLLPEA